MSASLDQIPGLPHTQSMNNSPSFAKRLVIGLSGASGMCYAETLVKALARLGHHCHLIVSPVAAQIFEQERGYPIEQLSNYCAGQYDCADLAAPMSSGSWQHDGMVICPCSMSSLGHIASGAGDNLIHRAADVCLKEGRSLILAARETPLSALHLENMLRLSRAGATVFPLCPSFYHQPQNLDDLVRHTCGRILDRLGLDNDLVSRWGQ